MSVVISILFSVPVEASQTKRFTESECFDCEWENTAIFYKSSSSDIIGRVVYGFDEFFIDEDYCWTQFYLFSHQAGICNDKGEYYDSVVRAGKWSEEEIEHKGDEVQYIVWLNSDAKVKYYTIYDTTVK